MYFKATEQMNVEEFQEIKLEELADLTQIDKFRWSRYFNGKVEMTTKTLRRAAKCLNMNTTTLLQAIELKQSVKKARID